MRPFYLDKQRNGYYRVRFVDPVTGLRGTGKSTHKKKYDEALAVVLAWMKDGVPDRRVNWHMLEKAKLSDVLHEFLGITGSPAIFKKRATTSPACAACGW